MSKRFCFYSKVHFHLISKNPLLLLTDVLTACSTGHFLLFAHTPLVNTTTNDIYPRFSCLLPVGCYQNYLPTHHCWDIPNDCCPRDDGWATAPDQDTASLQLKPGCTVHCWVTYWGNCQKNPKTISIQYHAGSISLQHCRLQNFYCMLQYRSSEIDQRD